MVFIKPYQPEVVLGLAVLVLLQFALLAGLNARLGYIRKTLRTLLTGLRRYCACAAFSMLPIA